MGFLSSQLQDDGNWLIIWEPQNSDFEGALDPKHSTNEAELHASMTGPVGTGKITANSRNGQKDLVPRPKTSRNSDKIRASLIEPGVYEIVVTPAEISEYRQTVNELAQSPAYVHVMAATNDRMLAQNVAHHKMVWLARYLDPDHRVETFPPGVRLAMSNFEAMQRMQSEIRDGRERWLGELMRMAMGIDWKTKIEDAQGHPMRPTRTLPPT